MIRTGFLAPSVGRFIRPLYLLLTIFVFVVGTPLSAQTSGDPQPATPVASAPGPEYFIGTQDLIFIAILESPELAREVRVTGDGTVKLPLLPSRIKIVGLTLAQAEALIARSYSEAGILNHPNVTVTLKELQSKPVTVMGAVRQPGVFQITGSINLVRAITQAGGITDEAGSVVQIVRGGKTDDGSSIEVKISDLRSGVAEANVPIYAGDIVNVPPAGRMYVLGAVNKPGQLLLTGDQKELTILRVLAMASDLTRFSKANKSVILRPNSATGQVDQIPVDIAKILKHKSQDMVVQPNDVLYIPESGSKRAFSKGMDTALQIATASLIIRR